MRTVFKTMRTIKELLKEFKSRNNYVLENENIFADYEIEVAKKIEVKLDEVNRLYHYDVFIQPETFRRYLKVRYSDNLNDTLEMLKEIETKYLDC